MYVVYYILHFRTLLKASAHCSSVGDDRKKGKGGPPQPVCAFGQTQRVACQRCQAHAKSRAHRPDARKLRQARTYADVLPSASIPWRDRGESVLSWASPASGGAAPALTVWAAAWPNEVARGRFSGLRAYGMSFPQGPFGSSTATRRVQRLLAAAAVMACLWQARKSPISSRLVRSHAIGRPPSCRL